MLRRAVLGGFASCIVLSIASTALGDGPPSIKGRWTDYGKIWDPPIHMVLARGAGDASTVLFWNGHEEDGPFPFCRIDVPPMGALSASGVSFVQAPHGNVFCSAHAHLANGRVLISGGQANAQEGAGLAMSYIFDPVAGTIDGTVPSLIQPRYYPSATQLADNAVVMLGGAKYAYTIEHGGRTSTGATLAEMHSLTMGDNPHWLAGEDENAIGTAAGCEPGPPALEGHSIVHDGNSLGNEQRRFLVFGGRYKDAQGNYVYSNDVYQLTGDYGTDAHDIVWTWCKLATVGDDLEGGAKPAPRWQHATEFVLLDATPSYGLVLYGGQDTSGNALGDVWVLELSHPIPSWRHITPAAGDTIPAPRWGHTMTLSTESTVCGMNNQLRLIVIGGRDRDSVRTDDTWALSVPLLVDFGCDNGHLWRRLESSGTPRYNHVAAFRATLGDLTALGQWDQVGVLVHGGMGADGSPLAGNQLWAFHDWDNTSMPLWTVRSLAGGPSGRAGHAASFEGHGKTWTMHGGAVDASGTQLSDEIWSLDLKSWPAVWHNVTSSGGPGALAEHVMVFDGMPTFGELTHLVEARRPEFFNPGLPSAPMTTVTQYPPAVNKKYIYYPMVHSMPDGRILLAGPLADSRVFTPCAATGGWGAAIPNAMYCPQGASVQYLPGKYMKCGGLGADGAPQSSTQVLDATVGGGLAWTAPASTALRPRAFQNLVLLPTGEVLATGGLVSGNITSSLEEHWPQIWTPPTPGNVNGMWGDTLSADPLRRGYHSTAILLPDGRVVAAGDFNDKPDPGAPDNARSWTVFEPPYLFGPDDQPYAARPAITGVPSGVYYGKPFSVGAASTTGLTGACLMRPSSVTHQRNFDQSYIPLSMTITSGTTLSLNAPDDPNVAPPGDYLLFLIKTDGGRRYPSIAKWVRVAYEPVPTIALSAYDLHTVRVSWTAPINSSCATENVHQVEYDLRMSSGAITSSNFGSAQRIATGDPGATGAPEEALASVVCSQRTYFALKVRTGAGIWSPMSNVPNIRICSECVEEPCLSAAGLPRELGMRLTSPTPSRGVVEFSLALPAAVKDQAVEMRILDVAGRQVVRLIDEAGRPGYRTVRWAGDRSDGAHATRGVYFAQLRVGAQLLKQTIVLLD